MCKLCDERIPQSHSASRRDFLKGTAATAAFAAGPNLFSAHPAAADGGDPPEDSGRPGRRYIIRGGSVLSMDPKVGDFAQADVLVQGKKILAVGPNLHAGDADVIDARGRIVMRGSSIHTTTSSRPPCAAFSPTASSSTTARAR